MKKHISITIDKDVIEFVEKIAVSYHRSVSQVLELAAIEYLKGKMEAHVSLLSTSASFEGSFSRADTYAGR
jgi:hypothetical protein